jgi:hypothetical protein
MLPRFSNHARLKHWKDKIALRIPNQRFSLATERSRIAIEIPAALICNGELALTCR